MSMKANPAMNQMSDSTRAIVPSGEAVGNESVPGGTTGPVTRI